MARRFFLYFGYVCALFLFQTSLLSGKDDQLAMRAVFEKARNIMNIKTAGMAGFQLLGDVRIWIKKDAAADGKYQLIWLPDGSWKEEIAFKNYKRVRIGDGKQFWQVRSSNLETPWVVELGYLLDVGRYLEIREKDTLKRLHSEKIEGADSDCIRDVFNQWTSHIFCFKPNSGELLKYVDDANASDLPWKIRWKEYSSFQLWSGKSFPRNLRGFNGKQLVIEIQLEDIKSLSPLPADFLNPPKDASVWADCATGEPWKLKDRVQPQYPESARISGMQGTVVMYAAIEEDGHISNLMSAHSAGNELDRAAASAVSQWRYERTPGCENSKGRTETLIEVAYTLRR